MERFWNRVDKQADNGCWEWQGHKGKGGYGTVRYGGKAVLAHRFSYELANGPIPKGYLIRHSCDNPACVNPEHLLAGTQADNMKDMVDRRRWGDPREYERRYGNAHMSPKEALEAKLMLAAGYPHTDIAEKFGVHKASISHMSRGKTWEGLDPQPDELAEYLKVHTPIVWKLRGERRRSSQLGSAASNAKLCDEDVRRIRRLASIGVTVGFLAETYAVTSPTISRILSGEGWPHLTVSDAEIQAFHAYVEAFRYSTL
ncbi:MAG: hypothetical protein DRH08_06660 [Deltaproteobacteria bacterium]|nr:MAG: hypothetical protein DRH08_06660 [Deltaproteobacteria bacterium]